MTDGKYADVPEGVRTELVRFVRSLRSAGADVPTNAAVPAAEAITTIDLFDRETTRVVLRATLIADPRDMDVFDRLFPRFWDRLQQVLDPDEADPPDGDSEDRSDRLIVPDPSEGDSSDSQPPAQADESDGGTGAEADSAGDLEQPSDGTDPVVDADEHDADANGTVSTTRYSPHGRSERIDARVPRDDTRVETAVERLTHALAGDTGRRYDSTTEGQRPDVRRALRTSFETGGVVVSLPHRTRRKSEVRGVVLADISRSVLDVIDRDFLVEFLRVCNEQWRSIRAFFFDTDSREITESLNQETTAGVYRELDRREAQWGGGTRIGDALETLRTDAIDAVDRRTVVFVISDGLEMGSIDELEANMAWLARRARLVVWLNPLAAAETYEPTASGMAAALPYVDVLVPFTGPDDLEEMSERIERYGVSAPSTNRSMFKSNL